MRLVFQVSFLCLYGGGHPTFLYLWICFCQHIATFFGYTKQYNKTKRGKENKTMIKSEGKVTYFTEGDGLIIKISGEVDHHSAVMLRRSADELIYKFHPAVTFIDLSDIDFMDSSGLGFIMGRHALMQKLGGRAVVLSPNEKVMKIIALAGLERIVEIKRKEEIKK